MTARPAGSAATEAEPAVVQAAHPREVDKAWRTLRAVHVAHDDPLEAKNTIAAQVRE
jgi:hypothetical protein